MGIALCFAGCHGDRAVVGARDVAPPVPCAASVAPPAPPPAASGGFYAPDPHGRATAILRADAPNMHYASLDPASCEAELGRRRIVYVRVPAMADVKAPVRLRGTLHGISVRTALPPPQREMSPWEIFDCRLVLAVDDFCGLLAKRDVVEIIHFNAYRSHAQRGCTAKYAGMQHCGGLALDIRSYTKKDGSVLDVEKDFHGRIGNSTCAGKAQPSPPAAAATEMWGYVCDAAAGALFNVILTPNYNAAHRNHMHVEVTPDAKWMLVR